MMFSVRHIPLDLDQFCLSTLRPPVVDGGHTGQRTGQRDPLCPNRDRFFLSPGHTRIACCLRCSRRRP
jgi:hypothetical protein